jgi:hypothetical protein
MAAAAASVKAAAAVDTAAAETVAAAAAVETVAAAVAAATANAGKSTFFLFLCAVPKRAAHFFCPKEMEIQEANSVFKCFLSLLKIEPYDKKNRSQFFSDIPDFASFFSSTSTI